NLRSGALERKCTTRRGSLNERLRRNKSLIRLKIAVFAPIASASVITAMMVNPGVLARVRSAYLKSEIIKYSLYSLGNNDGGRFHAARSAITRSTRDVQRAGSQQAIITTFAPIPSASVSTATKVNPGDLQGLRNTDPKSCILFGAQGLNRINIRS